MPEFSDRSISSVNLESTKYLLPILTIIIIILEHIIVKLLLYDNTIRCIHVGNAILLLYTRAVLVPFFVCFILELFEDDFR